MQPGSDMAKAEKLWAKRQKRHAARQARIRHLQQMQAKRQQRAAARRGERMPKKVSFLPLCALMICMHPVSWVHQACQSFSNLPESGLVYSVSVSYYGPGTSCPKSQVWTLCAVREAQKLGTAAVCCDQKYVDFSCPLVCLMQVEESDDDEGPGGDDDLYAFTSIADSPSQASVSNQEEDNQEADNTTRQRPSRSSQPGGFGGPTVFASMTLGMNHAVLQINRAFQQMSMRAQYRRCLTRPS